MKAILIPFLILLLTIALFQQSAVAQVKIKTKHPTNIPYDSIKLALENILEKDQGVRRKMHAAPPAERSKIIQEMQRIDSVNQVMVITLLARYGWLPKSKIGEKAADAQFYVVQHADGKLMEKYLPELKKLAQQDEARKTHAAMMEDRLLMDQRKKQIYGTQAFSNQFTQGKILIWPIEDYPNVNKRRQEVGFDTTVEENAKRLGAAYNPTEIIPGLLAE